MAGLDRAAILDYGQHGSAHSLGAPDGGIECQFGCGCGDQLYGGVEINRPVRGQERAPPA